MLSPTPRLGLLRPENEDDVRIADLNANSDILDDAPAVSYVVPVNGAYPSTPFDGMIIYDINTSQLKVWTAADNQWHPAVPILFGVPVGGTAGQALTKIDATNGNTNWRTLIPPGGAVGQVLNKNTATDYDSAWKTLLGIPAGGATGTILRKSSSADGAAAWAAPRPAQFDSGVASFSVPGNTVADTGSVTFSPAFTTVTGLSVVASYTTAQNSAQIIMEILGVTATQITGFRLRNQGSSTNNGSIYWQASIA